MPAKGLTARSAAARAEELKHAIATASDAPVRARLRVALAELLRVRDLDGAAEELRRAASEASGLPAVTLAVSSLARALPPDRRVALFDALAAEGSLAPAWSAAAAEALAEAGAPDRAAASWLALARDDAAPLHRRRVAARRAERLGGKVDPGVRRAALRVSAALSSGARRLAFLRQALALALGPGELAADADELLALVSSWLEAGGSARAIEPALARARALGASGDNIDQLADAARRHGPESRRARPAPRAPSRVLPRSPRRLTIEEQVEAAQQDARAGHAARARKAAEAALRLAARPPAALVAGLETTLREAGHLEEALRLRRTYIEALPRPEQTAPLLGLADEAAQAGLAAMASAFRADAGARTPPRAAPKPLEPVTPAEHYLAAQRLLAVLPPDGAADAALARLHRAVAGHPGADAALDLAEKLLARVATGNDLERRRLELLRVAHSAEVDSGRRARLGERLAAALARLKDPVGAVAVLERALEGMPPGEGGRLRAERARLLREIGRPRDLAAALEADASALSGGERLRALAERAALLEAAGEPERALEGRLLALAEFPSDLAVLTAARRRLESTGRPDDSLRLAVAAVGRVNDEQEKLRLLREIATLSERGGTSGGNLPEAAAAWLAVLEIDPDDAGAFAAAERLLMAVADWGRCAELLAWAAGRSSSGPAKGPAPPAMGSGQQSSPSPTRSALLWRLAELRRARLGQRDEAVRLYGELAATVGLPLGALDGAPVPEGLRHDPEVMLETARAEVAPSPPERARALLDRGLVLLERGRTADAERDVMHALDLDPLNIECIGALERLYHGTARWTELAQELRRRAAGVAPNAAARLWYGAGRAAERLADRVAAREAYRRAMSLDGALAEPISALGALAARDGDWKEVAALLESEATLAASPTRKARLLVELAAVYGERLSDPQRAVDLLEAAAEHLPVEPRLLELAGRFNLAVGRWEPAARALDELTATGTVLPDAAELYHRAAAAAEAEGKTDRALVLYSRSYARNSGHRPTLERLSAICFDKGQWDNTWKATEALLERHGATLTAAERATLLVRSALADLHIAQRAVAAGKLSAGSVRSAAAGPTAIEAGVRDVAESWGGMRLEPRLLAEIDRLRRDRSTTRATEALALAQAADEREPARDVLRAQARLARQMLGALALVQKRWDDALAVLTALGDDEEAAAEERCGFLMAAGDLVAGQRGDRAGAERLYQRAAALSPHDSRLVPRLPAAAAATHDVTDEMLV
jgi:tetratricopeptide (TPR) repeat protein